MKKETGVLHHTAKGGSAGFWCLWLSVLQRTCDLLRRTFHATRAASCAAFRGVDG